MEESTLSVPPPQDATTTTSTRPPPTLYHLSSSQSLRVLWALEELAATTKQPYTLKSFSRIKARAPPELQEIFPLGKSPMLVVEAEGESGTRTVAVTESRLILQYISDHYSHSIWEPSANFRARNEFWQEFANASLSPLITLLVTFGILPSQTPVLARPLTALVSMGAVPQLQKELLRPFALMEDALSSPSGEDSLEYDSTGLSPRQPWFAGDKIGLADFNLSWPMDNATQRGYLDVQKYPKLAAWMERVHARPAYKRALEKGGVYDLKTFEL